jgi:MFS family permease
VLKLSGIGGGGIFTTATVITSDMFSMRDRSLAQGVSNIFNGVTFNPSLAMMRLLTVAMQAGMGLGGPLGGYISDRFDAPRLASIYRANPFCRFGWRWAFLIQIPIFVISFILTGSNLRYVTPVRRSSICSCSPCLTSATGQEQERERRSKED